MEFLKLRRHCPRSAAFLPPRLALRHFTSSTDETDAELVSKILLQHHNPFHAMESSLQLHGITLTPNLLTQTLLRLKHHSKIALSLFNYAKSLPNPPLSHSSFHLLIDTMAKVRQFDLAWQLITEMDQRSLTPNPSTFLVLIRRLVSAGLTRQAVRAFNDIDAFSDTKTTSEHFTVLLDTLCKYNCFFKEYRGRKDADSALKLFKKMKEDGLCSPTAHTYGVLLQMFLKADMIGVVKEIWRDMKESGVGPDLDLYTLLIHGLCERKKWREACQFFVEMIEKGFFPQKVTFETLYRGLIQSDMLRTWRRLKKKLDEESISFGSEFQNYQLMPYRR